MVDEVVDQKEKIKRQDNRIKLKDKETIQEDIQEYATTKTYTYEVDDDTNADLQEIFREDFRDWTRDIFNNLKTKQLIAL